MARTTTPPEASTATWTWTGALFGMVAGILMALFLMLAEGAMGQSFWLPLRRTAGILLGASALDPAAYATGTVVLVGLAVHLVWSAIFGAIFGLLAAAVEGMRRDRVMLALSATLYGAGLWILNYYIIGPLAFPWFAQSAPVSQFVAHTFFYGTVLGTLMTLRVEVPSAAEV